MSYACFPLKLEEGWASYSPCINSTYHRRVYACRLSHVSTSVQRRTSHDSLSEKLFALFLLSVSDQTGEISAEATYGLTLVTEVAAIPVALVSMTCYDANYRVENLIQYAGARSTSVAMAHRKDSCYQAIATAPCQGTRVLICFWPWNKPSDSGQQSRLIMKEFPPGIKANLLDSLRAITPRRLSLQRKFGFNSYCNHVGDFNDSDMASAFSTIKTWLQPPNFPIYIHIYILTVL